MSEEIQKSFVVTKIGATDVYMIVHPISNPTISRVFNLTSQRPSQTLPLDWALGIIADQGCYEIYKQGYITFDKNEELAKEAMKAGVWFDEVFDFTPANPADDKVILEVLKTGQRSRIISLFDKFSKERVRDIAIANKDNVTTAVIKVLEDIFQLQFAVDGE